MDAPTKPNKPKTRSEPSTHRRSRLIDAIDQCPLLAQSGHPDALNQCPLLGVKRTSA